MKALLAPTLQKSIPHVVDNNEKEHITIQPTSTTVSPLPESSWLKSDALYAIGLVDRSPGKDKPNNKVILSNEIQKHFQPDRPKALIPSKGLSTYVKSAKFNPYKSTRPELLTELNELVDKRDKSVRNYKNVNDVVSSLSTTKVIFQRFIDESTIYQQILSSVKSEYDTTLDRLTDEIKAYSKFDSKLTNKQIEHEAELERINLESQSTIKALEEQVRQLAMKATCAEQDRLVMESELRAVLDAQQNTRKECEELRTTGVTLSNSLSRLEEEKRQYQEKDAAAQSEVAVFRGNEQKLNEEIERLQQLIQGMETIQSSMVSHEVLVAQENAMDTLHAEMKRVDTTHRQLLLRYTAIKAVADGAFKKFESNEFGSGSSAFEQSRVQSKVHEIANKRGARGNKGQQQGKKATVAPTDAADKLMQMVERGANPRLIIESLLDIIEVSQMDGGRTTHGNGSVDSGSALLSNVLPGGTIAFDGNFNSTAEEFRSPWSHFDGLGFEPHVPNYLRFNGKVQNLYLSRQELVLLLNEIWALKLCHERTAPPVEGAQSTEESQTKTTVVSTVPSRPVTACAHITNILNTNLVLSNYLVKSLPANPSLAAFLEVYLEDKFNSHMRAVEMAYNIVDALRKYSTCSDAMMFCAILEGRLCQEVWQDQYVQTDRLKEELLKENSAHSTSPDLEWRLTQDMLMRTLRKALPTKGEHSFSKLTKALAVDNKGNRFVNVTELLSEDENGHRSEFFEQLKLQHITECVSFERHVMDCVDQFNKSSNESEMSLNKLREALIYADSHKTRTEINHLLARACNLSVEETLLMEARRTPLSVEEFKRRLRSGLLKRSAPMGPPKNK